MTATRPRVSPATGSQAFQTASASDPARTVFYNPDRPMRDLRSPSLRARGSRYVVAVVLVVCAVIGVPSWRSTISRATAAVFGESASQAAAQTPETFIQQARRAFAHGRYAEAEALAKARPAADSDAAAVLGRARAPRPVRRSAATAGAGRREPTRRRGGARTRAAAAAALRTRRVGGRRI